MKTRIFVSVILCMCVLFALSAFAVPTAVDVTESEIQSPAILSAEKEIVESGTCGDNLTWTLDSEGTLTISGEGEMYDWTSGSEVPWYSVSHSTKTVVIKDGITSVGNYAFEYFGNLISAKISDSVKLIGRRAFTACKILESVTMGNMVEIIGRGAFQQCDKLKCVTFPDSLVTIEPDAFYGCDLLEEIVIPDNVTSIGSSAFRYCYSMEHVSIGKSLSSIGEWAFSQGKNLKRVVVSEDNKNYSSDENGILFNKNKTILIQYPLGNNSLTYTISNRVLLIKEMAFSGCNNLTRILVEQDNENYSSDENGVLYNKDKTAIIQFPVGSASTFAIPAEVTSVGTAAFWRCDSIKEIVLQEGISEINALAFYQCTNLLKAAIYNKNVIISANAFLNCHDGFTLYGHVGSTTESYAKENNIPFVDLNSIPSYTPGELNGDGVIDMNDAILLLQYSMFPELYPIEYAGSVDFTGDGNVDMNDAILLLQHSMFPELYPIA